ncbi:MAG: hypothetical protein E6Q97_14330 [Desulfurellales bacterium]|nr:MAG: hypothetical protein E6Q97_14330 [Desulfurellales bacterium]
MKVVLCSAFRDACGYLDGYLEQMTGLHLALAAPPRPPGDRLHCVWGEGDSTDDTLGRLTWAYTYARWAITIVDCTHGGPRFGSVVNAERFRQLAHVGKQIFAAIPDDADVVVYVESDLVWEPATLLALIERVASGGYAVISPMVFLQREGWPADSFYDTFAFRAEDRHFAHYRPYHAVYRTGEPFQVDSAGSCLVMRGEIARSLHFDEQTIFPDLCRQIRASGNSIWVDPGCGVYHL